MSMEIKVPQLPESINEATVATWHKKPGEQIKRDENLVDIETDKVMLEIVAPADGSLEKIIKDSGSTVKAEEVIALFKEGAVKESGVSKEGEKSKEKVEAKEEKNEVSPSLRRLAGEKGVDLTKVAGSGKEGEITKEDIVKAGGEVKESEKYKSEKTQREVQVPEKKEEKKKETEGKSEVKKAEAAKPLEMSGIRPEKRVPMTRLRARIAERLLEAQHNAAILTTFNEINMLPVMTLRQKYRESFEKTYGIRLGYMSFFTLAVIEALKHFPAVNASIDGNDIIYHGYYDIGIAVSTNRGLVVPIIKNAETLTMAEIEKQISTLAKKADAAQLTMEDITGGTFTITNGGVFGSLMATPILNPPPKCYLRHAQNPRTTCG